MTAILES